MISRRDNILKRPWEIRIYQNHRRKVQLAAPVIDNKPPPQRNHVNIKLKKLQNEYERCQKIENDNYLLWKKLNYVMKTNRIDNIWKTPQPSFLNKIAMYDTTTQKLSNDFYIDTEEDLEICSKAKKCPACNPYKTNLILIPEERVPWEPIKQSFSRKRSKSVPVRKPEINTIEKTKINNDDKELKEKPKSASKAEEKTIIIKQFEVVNKPKIVIKRGGLHVNVNFPSDSMVKFYKNHQKKTLMSGVCNCKMIRTV